MLAAVVCVAAHAQRRQTFCNPIDIPYRYAILDGDDNATSFREAADPTVVTFKGEYYLFASKCGVYYHSTDLVNWDAIHTSDLPMEGYAPTVVRCVSTGPTSLGSVTPCSTMPRRPLADTSISTISINQRTLK